MLLPQSARFLTFLSSIHWTNTLYYLRFTVNVLKAKYEGCIIEVQLKIYMFVASLQQNAVVVHSEIVRYSVTFPVIFG